MCPHLQIWTPDFFFLCGISPKPISYNPPSYLRYLTFVWNSSKVEYILPNGQIMVYETIFFTSGLKITCTRAVVHSLQFNNIDAHLFFNIALSQGLSIGFKSTMKSHFYCSLILCEVLLFFFCTQTFVSYVHKWEVPVLGYSAHLVLW